MTPLLIGEREKGGGRGKKKSVAEAPIRRLRVVDFEGRWSSKRGVRKKEKERERGGRKVRP